MKHFLPLTFALFLAACAAPTPQETEAQHQAQLEKEAQENFYTLKAQINPRSVPRATPTPALRFFASLASRPTPSRPQPTATPITSQRPRSMPRATPTPTPAPGFFASLVSRPAPSHPQPAATPVTSKQAKRKPTPVAEGRIARKKDDTLYYWQVPPQQPSQKTNPRYRAAEIGYARELAKRPEDLTPDERVWAHEHY